MLFDTLVRYSSITILMVLVLLLVRDARQHQAARFAALEALSVAALLLTTPYPQLELSPIPHTILRFVDAPSIAFIWWFGRSLFEDDGYTDLMVDGAPLPHQPDTIIRWLIDRLRS